MMPPPMTTARAWVGSVVMVLSNAMGGACRAGNGVSPNTLREPIDSLVASRYSSISDVTVSSLVVSGLGSARFGLATIAHSLQMLAEIGRAHERLAALEAIDRIGPEIVRRVLVHVLDDAPQRPQQIAHRLVEHHPAAIAGGRLAAEIGFQQRLVLLRAEGGLDRDVAQVPHRIVVAGIF